jgi:hypothetical protein
VTATTFRCGHPREGNTIGASAKKPHGQCKTCSNAYSLKYRARNLERHQAAARKWHADNRERVKANMMQWRAANPGQHWRQYGILNRAGQPFVWSDYAALHEMQGGACLLCGHVPAPGEPRLVPDHCHTTGICRALVCGVCNRIEGLMAANGINALDYAARLVVLRLVPAVLGLKSEAA